MPDPKYYKTISCAVGRLLHLCRRRRRRDAEARIPHESEQALQFRECLGVVHGNLTCAPAAMHQGNLVIEKN